MLNLAKVKVPPHEADKLKERLSNWDKLHGDLAKNGATVPLLEKMIKVEVTSRKRLVLVTRLLGIYNRLVREANEAMVLGALNRK